MNTSTGTNMMNSSSAASSATKAKRVAKKTDEVAAPAPVVAAPAPVAAAPAAEAKKAVAKKAAAPAPAAPVAAPAVPVAAPATPAAATEAPAAPATTLDEDLKSVLTTLTSLRETISTMITEVKRLDKRVHREIKDARKRKRRVRTEAEGDAPKRLTIFEIPLKVSDELCKFLGHPTGTLISRSNVTKQVNNYVKEKGLKNKHNITPDAALKKILQVPEGEQLTYFNLQKYLNKHYIKEVKPTA
jgi:hypothetical protein